MKKITKLLILALVVIMVASMTACGGSNGGNGSNNQSSAIEGNKLSLKTNTAATKTLTVEYLQAGFGNDPYIAVANAFMEKYPEYQISLVPNRNIGSTTGLMLESGNADELSDVYCIQTSAATIKNWAVQGYLADFDDVLTSTIDEKGTTVADSMYDTAKEALTIDTTDVDADHQSYVGKMFGIPEYISFHGFIYNKDLFAQYGWEVPETTAELEALCKQIIADTDGEVDPITWFSDSQGYVYFATHDWISQYEGYNQMSKFYSYSSAQVYAVEDNEEGSIGTGKNLAMTALNKFFMPISEGGYAYNNSRKVDYTSSQLRVVRKQSAMVLGGTWFENEMALYLKDENMGIFPIPQLSDDNGNVLHSAYNTDEEGSKRVLEAEYAAYYIIPAECHDVEGAKLYMNFMSTEAGCEVYTRYAKTVRPFNYNVSADNPAYEGITEYGKDILNYTESCTFFIPMSKSLVALKGGATMFWKSLRAEADVVTKGVDCAGTIKKILNDDYSYAKAQFSSNPSWTK